MVFEARPTIIYWLDGMTGEQTLKIILCRLSPLLEIINPDFARFRSKFFPRQKRKSTKFHQKLKAYLK